MSTQRWWDTPDEESYVLAILATYVSLPQTPDDAQMEDRYQAFELYRQGYELENVEAALMLGTARRIFANPHSYGPRFRSLKEFAPYIEELHNETIDTDYVKYLRHLLSPVMNWQRLRQREKLTHGTSVRARSRR